MAELWKPQSIEIYQDWIKAIIDEASDELNIWEETFISDIETRLISNRNLTEGQADKLEQIYVKYTS